MIRLIIITIIMITSIINDKGRILTCESYRFFDRPMYTYCLTKNLDMVGKMFINRKQWREKLLMNLTITMLYLPFSQIRPTFRCKVRSPIDVGYVRVVKSFQSYYSDQTLLK